MPAFCSKIFIMDTDFIEKTIRNYAHRLKDGNQTEKEVAEELARIADKLKQKGEAEKIAFGSNTLHTGDNAFLQPIGGGMV